MAMLLPVTERVRPVVTARPTFIIAAVTLGVIVLMALFPGLFTRVDPLAADLTRVLQAPSAQAWLGTDQLGRDVYARLVYGARESLTMGVGATVIAVVLGSLIGILSASSGRFVDSVLMRGIDIMLAFPNLLLALLVITVVDAWLGKGVLTVMIAIGLGGFANYARVARGQAMVVRRSGYVEAAYAMGLSRASVILRHVTPNALSPILVLATIGVGVNIITSAALSFLGLGPAAPAPEWGLALADGRNLIGIAWWVSFFPGLAIMVSVLAVTTVGRFAQARFEGRRAS